MEVTILFSDIQHLPQVSNFPTGVKLSGCVLLPCMLLGQNLMSEVTYGTV